MNLLVKTGFMFGAGTDANVYVTLEDENGVLSSQKKLDKLFHDDLERGTLDSFSIKIPNDFSKVKTLHLERDEKGMKDDWYCEYIIVQDPRALVGKSSPRKIKNKCHPGVDHREGNDKRLENYFPVHRWISHEHKYIFHEYATYLRQNDPTPNIRHADLLKKRSCYTYINKVERGPAQVSNVLLMFIFFEYDF